MADGMDGMTTEQEAQAAPVVPRPSGAKRALLLGGVTFLIGVGAAAYTVHAWHPAAEFLTAGLETSAQPAPTTTSTPLAVVPSLPATDPMAEAAIDRRVAEIESRLGQIDVRASAAVGNADRAEALLVAFAARRALDRGVQLGYIEGLLRDRFGTSQPQAVATVIAAGHQPVTLDELRAGLVDIAPKLASQAPNEDWWDGFKREIAGLIVVRKANAPSPAPADRLARARRALEAGRVAEALAEVSRMPGREQATNWIAAARRYDAARDALDTIETAALLMPRPPVAAAPAPSPKPEPAPQTGAGETPAAPAVAPSV